MKPSGKEKYRVVIEYFKSVNDTEAIARAERKPLEYFEQNRIYDILEELKSR